MIRFEVLLEGASDMPAVKEILERRFGLKEGRDFRLHPHRGKGSLPADILGSPPVHRQGLLDQLPAKLRGFSYLDDAGCVVILVDADDQPCVELLASLEAMLARLPRRPRHVLFRIAIEETESWFIADPNAVEAAFPKARTTRLRRLVPDTVVGACEQLARVLGLPASEVPGAAKFEWATRIAPHLELDEPRSPSLRKFVEGIGRYVDRFGLAPARGGARQGGGTTS